MSRKASIQRYRRATRLTDGYALVPLKVSKKKEQKPIPEATDNIDVDIDDILGPTVTKSAAEEPISAHTAEPQRQYESKPERATPKKPKPSNQLPSPTPSFADLSIGLHSTPKPVAAASGDKPRPGRIISNSRPLTDFRKNIGSEGDLVSKAIEDMCEVIPEIVDASFSTQRYAEAIECMKELREVALKACSSLELQSAQTKQTPAGG